MLRLPLGSNCLLHEASSMPPNILFILSDDQGPWALGSAGNTEIHTPHLDALAAAGVRCENFFCTSPVCSPARASLLTGAIPSAHGVHDWVADGHAGPKRIDFLANQPVVTEAFADQGYRVGIVGKLHLGASDRPRAGYSHWVVLEGGGSPYQGATVYRGTKAETVDGYLTDFFADEAISFLEDAASDNGPFFLSLNFTAPHKPWKGQHPRRFEALYDDVDFSSCPQETPHPWLATRDGLPVAAEPDIRAALVGYFAAVSAMDDAIGRVLEHLHETGLADNTIVVFSSDNGFNCGHHGIWGKGNGTFPQNMYDSSVKVPFLISAPGLIHSRRVEEQLLSAYDLPATLLELAGLDPAPFESGPGRSFASLLTAGPTGELTADNTHQAEPRPVVVFDEYGPTRMIRTARHKYVHRYPFGPHEFYDLVADPNESINLVDEPDQEELVQSLRGQLQSWFQQHAITGRDGSALPVTGGGQVALVDLDPFLAFLPRK